MLWGVLLRWIGVNRLASESLCGQSYSARTFFTLVVSVLNHFEQMSSQAIVHRIYGAYNPAVGVSIDSRTVRSGAIFFGMPGRQVNGGEYLEQVLSAGAALAVIQPEYLDGCDSELRQRAVAVDDVVQCLQAVAIHHRGQIAVPVIGVTGTNGKTTTRMLLQAALAAEYRVGGTEGNLNNELGVPLTLLNQSYQKDILVIEMGANHPQEIAALCRIAQPTHGLITSIGEAHLEGFGSVEGVARTKGELFQYLKAHGGTSFVRVDDARIAALSEEIHLGCSASNYSLSQYKVSVSLSASSALNIRFAWQGRPYALQTNLIGVYNTINVIAALHVAHYFNVPLEAACLAVGEFAPQALRSQMIRCGALSIIADCYNANPMSMRAAIENFAQLRGEGRAYIILGEMRELGAVSQEAHRNIAALVMALPAVQVYFVGEAWNGLTGCSKTFKTVDEVQAELTAHPIAEGLVLLKGSRAVALEGLIPMLRETAAN